MRDTTFSEMLMMFRHLDLFLDGGKYFAEFRVETRVSRNMMDCDDIDDTMKKNFNDNKKGILC